MLKHPLTNSRPGLVENLLTAGVYFVLARLSLLLQFQSSNATPVWPPSGFAFAIILLLGYRIVPGIMLGAFVANVLIFNINKTAPLPVSILLALLISIGNTGESITGYYLLRKMIPTEERNNFFLKVNHIFKFSFAALLMCFVSCTIGATTNFVAGIITSKQYPVVWFTWWLGDFSAILLITSFILIWVKFFRAKKPFLTGNWTRKTEIFVLFLLVLLSSGIVFDNWFFPLFIFRWAFWMIPVLMWAALRFNHHKTITAILLCSAVAVWGTINKHGPFFTGSLNESLLTLQAFISIITITQLTLNASVMERKQTEETLRNTGIQLEIRVKERTAELKHALQKAEDVNMELQEQKAFAELLIESSPDMILVYDRQLRIIAWNKKSEAHTGLKKEQVIGQHTFELFPEYNNESWLNAINEVFTGKSLHYPKIEFKHTAGWGESFLIPLHNIHNEVIGLLSITRDITELVKMTSAIEQKNKDLEEMNRELASFSYVASHDLQEPLRKIQMFSKRILEKEIEMLSANGKEMFNRINNASGRMQQLILDLLTYSRTNTSEKYFEKTDLNVLVQQVKNELTEKLNEVHATVEISDLPKLKVIPFQFHQLFTNMLSNSLKFVNHQIQPHILIKADIVEGNKIQDADLPGQKKYHRIAIMDNGIGFEPTHNHQIFELFQRLHARSEYEGTGIGLAICKKIVENHNGTITASGQPGKGATFTIYLPTDEL
jgi:PAS domain S-box-containing protein